RGVGGGIEVVGDVMHDVCLRLSPVAREHSTALVDNGLEPAGYVLATIHREANVRPVRLNRILSGLTRLDEPVLFPAHPRTAAVVRSEGLLTSPEAASVTLPREAQARPASTLLGQVRLSQPFSSLHFAARASRPR